MPEPIKPQPRTPTSLISIIASFVQTSLETVCHSERSEEPMHFACAIRRHSLPRLPASRIALAVEAGDYHNSTLLYLEEHAIRKAPHTRTPTVPVDDRELQWTLRDRLNRGLDRQRETLPKLRANAVIPCPRFQQILVRIWYPDDRECHGFLNRPALTCCHGMTSEGSCSCRVIR